MFSALENVSINKYSYLLKVLLEIPISKGNYSFTLQNGFSNKYHCETKYLSI